jgi:hypothetical protein
LLVVVGFLLFPEQIARLTGSEQLLEWLRDAFPFVR